MFAHARIQIKVCKKLYCVLIHTVYLQWKFSQKGVCVSVCVCMREKERTRETDGERVHQELSMHKEIKREYFSRAIEAHLLNNDDSSSFSTTIEGT